MTLSELQTAAVLLRHAAASAQWCSLLFHGAGDDNRAARMRDQAERLTDEAKAIDTMIANAAAKP